jgi:hypothetical protein
MDSNEPVHLPQFLVDMPKLKYLLARKALRAGTHSDDS